MNVHIAPITVKQATALVKCWHRHLPKVQGGLFAAAVAIEDEIFAVAIVGNPPRVWQGTGRAVILRVAVSPCAPEEIAGHANNLCSRLYGALSRAAEALGYREIWTYTLPEEPGTSLRAAGFEHMGMTEGGTWSRPSRKRDAPVKGEAKHRWRRILNPR